MTLLNFTGRGREPATYRFRISHGELFSGQPQNSLVFEVGTYRWRLVAGTRLDENEDENVYLTLLLIHDNNLTCIVDADVKFYIRKWDDNMYRVYQVTDNEKYSHFSSAHEEISDDLINIEEIQDTSNGYFYDNVKRRCAVDNEFIGRTMCEFGVDILVRRTTVEEYKVIPNPIGGHLVGTRQFSPTSTCPFGKFTVDKIEWSVKIQRNERGGDTVLLALELTTTGKTRLRAIGETVDLDFKVQVVAKDSNRIIVTGTKRKLVRFSTSTLSWTTHLKLSELDITTPYPTIGTPVTVTLDVLGMSHHGILAV